MPGTRRLLRKRTGAAPGGSQRQRERERERERQESRRRQREARLQKRNRSRLRAQAVHAEGAALEGRSIKAYSWLQVWFLFALSGCGLTEVSGIAEQFAKRT